MRLRRLPLSRALAAPLVVAALAVTATAAAGGPTWLVKRGDTLSQIALDHHTTVAVLRKLNHIPADSDLILVGQVLKLPGTGAAHADRSAAAKTTTVRYIVRPGDSVIAIARHYHVSPAVISKRNHLPSSGLILIGQHLAIPVPAAKPVVRHYSAKVTAAAAHHRAQLAHRSVPSKAAARALVEKTARAMGVDPALALAIARMESGFQQRVVSPADAIGIMQVLPSTVRFIADDVLHERLDPLDARDNVRAGVALLRLLTKAAPLPQAVAGYYQGLASVRSHGMYADTRHYVDVVLALHAHYRRG